MPKYKIALEPKRPKPDPDGDREEGPSGIMNRAKDVLSGRYGERREKKRNRAPRNMLGRRG